MQDANKPVEKKELGILSSIGKAFTTAAGYVWKAVKGIGYFVTGAVASTVGVVTAIIGLPILVGKFLWTIFSKKKREEIWRKTEEGLHNLVDNLVDMAHDPEPMGNI